MKVISFGHRCSSASLLKLLNLKEESYPFDWLVSKLSTVKACIEDDFKNFLNVDNYVELSMKTYNIIDGIKCHAYSEPGIEKVLVNMFYETNKETDQTYNVQLGINHRNIKIEENLDYYKRCIARLNELLKSDVKKLYIYIHPIMGPNDYSNKKESIVNEFAEFDNFILTKTSNIFGIYFILVMADMNTKYTILEKTEMYIIYIVYFNNNCFDMGWIFQGDDCLENSVMMNLIKNYI